jgi:iron-sulfur cluster assembly protein
MIQPITLNDEAARQIREKTAQKDCAAGLRLIIDNTGCSGHSYRMEHAMAQEPTDDRFEKDGAVLFVPKMQSWMLFGTVVGFEETDLKSGFTFTNPNESGRCGCGESFMVDRPQTETV